MTNSTASLVLSLLTTIFALLSTSYVFQPHGVQIVKNITPDHWRRLNVYVTGGQGKGKNAQGGNNELILVTLRLLTVISEKWDPKRVFESFSWESKALPKLFTLRRKTNASPLVKPGASICYHLLRMSSQEQISGRRSSCSFSRSFRAARTVASTHKPKLRSSQHRLLYRRFCHSSKPSIPTMLMLSNVSSKFAGKASGAIYVLVGASR